MLLSNPIITPSVPESCPGDLITLTASDVPQTALDFELANITTLTKLPRTWTDPDGVTSYYFYELVKRSWENSFDRIAIYGVGASMYQINDLDEHNTVWEAIKDASINGTVPFWLGLKQDGIKTNDFDSGWRWLDGTKLPPGSTLWDLASQEPNDYDFTRPAGCGATPDCDGKEDGSEDYGHFNLGGNGKLLNDYPDFNPGTGDGSYSLYEFSGTTTVKWYYQLADDPANPGNRGPKDLILDGSGVPVNLTEIEVNPDVTTFYILEVDTNGVVCEAAEYKHVVNPLPVPTAVGNLELCDEIDPTDPASTNTDGISYSFDLDSQTALIVDGQVDRDWKSFYCNLSRNFN